MASGRVAIVTGANKGIGYHIAKQLVASRQFGRVVLGCRDARLGAKAAAEVGGEFMQLDVSSPPSIGAFMEAFQAQYGRLDCLVNNAGIMFQNSDPTPFAEQTGPTLAVNFDGTVALTEALLPLLNASSESPRVVNVSSQLGYLSQVSAELQAQFSAPALTMGELRGLVAKFKSDVAAGKHRECGWGNSNYGMSKLALIAATKVWARENPNIMINACCPGWCSTDMGTSSAPVSPEDGAKNATLLAVELPAGGPTGAFYRNFREARW